MPQSTTYYDLLEIKETASEQVIKGAYRFLSQKWHPDRNLDNQEEAERITKLLNEAYAVLSDDVKRAEYDERLNSQRSTSGQSSHNKAPPPQQPPASVSRSKKGAGKLQKISAAFALLVLSIIVVATAIESGAAVGVRVTFSPSCYADSLLVTTTNRLPVSLRSHSYRISGALPGYSNAVRGDMRDYESDEIISGWSSSSTCRLAPPGFNDFRMPRSESEAINRKDNPHLVWRAELKSARWAGPFHYSNY